MKATSELQTLVNIFNENKYEIRLAGGAVRDLLLGKQPNDLDFATTAKPEQIKDMFSSVSNVQLINLTSGEKHGTITARINDKENFEITTLRIDVDTDGRHAEVEFTTDWKQDAERRDLTINSMFIGSDGTLYDYCGGWEDLTNGRVNFVGDARTRMKEDYLRILRYFRFCARFSEDPRRHTQDTEEAIRENVAGLAGVSGERIWSELTKILKSRHAGSLLDMMIRIGMGPHIGLPDELNLEEFMTVWERTNSNEIRLQPVSILTSLLKLGKSFV